MINKLDIKDCESIENFIYEIDNEFNPALTKKINPKKWSKKILELGYSFGIVENNKLKAIISFYPNENTSSFISLVAVSKDLRGKGISKQLLIKCINHCKEVNSTSIKVETWSKNQKALNLYKSFGFEITETIKDRGNDYTACLLLKLGV